MMIGVGVDIIEIERVAKLCAKEHAKERLFSPEELGYAAAKGRPVPTLAGFFAAKEAVGKALGQGLSGLRLRDIEVGHSQLNQPLVKLHGAAASRAAALGVKNWSLSISHDDTAAIAFTVAEG